MPKMIILRGVSGSGKSTWARNQQGMVVSRDAIRVMQFGTDGPDYYKVDKAVLSLRENQVTVIQDAMIEAGLRSGADVIVDNTNIEWKYVKALAKIAHRVGAEVEVKVFDVPVDHALHQNRYRGWTGGREVPDDVIRKQHQRLQGSKDKTLEPAFVPAPYNGTPGKPRAFMYDLDGTVYHMNDKRGPYDHNVDVDDPDREIQNIVFALWSHGLTAIAMSGRKTATRETTIKCLERDAVPFNRLFMRADGDDRPDNIIKAELFDTHVRDNFDVQFVIDDRAQVVRMWKQMGLKVLNVSGIDDGEF